MIRIDSISKSFDKNDVLCGASLDIPDGSIVGLTGRSGTGKSTLAKIVCGLLSADGGNIYIDENPLYNAKGKYDRKLGLKIQMVYQQPSAVLDPSQKIRAGFAEIIRYHRLAGRKEIDSYIDKIAEEAEIEKDVLNHLPRQISGGEAQRVAIAKSLLFQPKLLVLDEATSMLDASTQANVLALVKRIAETGKSSILLISHDMELVDFYCRTVYEIRDKKIYKVGEEK